ncbi:hypothetical protein Nepgr_015157 [Nepenthes gracilis]|uniref:Uncharacterized protein n=1 Tax=Nepenthes gracilis TaxID=150966 RepID=A0AAD3SN48_NEPGR|nr:hypothetical protein Nepgr_015157 [Nepenthes gracilis]
MPVADEEGNNYTSLQRLDPSRALNDFSNFGVRDLIYAQSNTSRICRSKDRSSALNPALNNVLTFHYEMPNETPDMIVELQYFMVTSWNRLRDFNDPNTLVPSLIQTNPISLDGL